MADNLEVTAGSGTTVAADDIAGVLHQRVKLSVGADGAATDALGGAGAVAAGVQRVTLASDDPAVVALQIIDDWDESDRAKVNLVAGQAGISAGAGAVAANTPRVTLASDDPAVAAITGAIYVDDADWTAVTSKHALIGGIYQGTPGTITDGDTGPVRVTENGFVMTADQNVADISAVQGATMPAERAALGALLAGGSTLQQLIATAAGELTVNAGAAVIGPGQPVVDSYATAAISAAAGTANQSVISAPGANKQIWVYGWGGTADTGDGSISLQDEDDTAVSGVMPVAQNGGFCHPPSGNFSMPVFQVATNKALEIDTVTCGFKGWITYAVVDVS